MFYLDGVQGMFGHDECILYPDHGGDYMDIGVCKIHCNVHLKYSYFIGYNISVI